jgi:hypothetical protein
VVERRVDHLVSEGKAIPLRDRTKEWRVQVGKKEKICFGHTAFYVNKGVTLEVSKRQLKIWF